MSEEDASAEVHRLYALGPIQFLRESLNAEAPQETIQEIIDRDRRNLRGVDAWAVQNLPTLSTPELLRLRYLIDAALDERPEETADTNAAHLRNVSKAEVQRLHAMLVRLEWRGDRLLVGEIEELIARWVGVSKRTVQRILGSRQNSPK